MIRTIPNLMLGGSGGPFDVDAIRLPASSNEPRPASKRTPVPRHRPGEKFIKGPIPLDWITAASQLPGKAMAVGMAVWFLSGMSKFGRVRITGDTLRLFNVSRQTFYRALDELEGAGLIVVHGRRKGACPFISLQSVGPTQPDQREEGLSPRVDSEQQTEATNQTQRKEGSDVT